VTRTCHALHFARKWPIFAGLSEVDESSFKKTAANQVFYLSKSSLVVPTMPSPCPRGNVVVHWGIGESSKCSFRPLWELVAYLVAMFMGSLASTAVMEVAEAWRVEEKALASAAEAARRADAAASLRLAALAIETACSLLALLSYAFFPGCA
jgi:hypothetical protein